VICTELLLFQRAQPYRTQDLWTMDSLRGGGRHCTLPGLVDVAAVRPLDRMLLFYDEPIDR
jgi:hypothetical protein